MTIKAIETEYDGHIFRSRLEARWAVFFNAMAIRYEYEPEGYEGLEGVKYLPDFRLPDLGVYAEVKGSDEKLEEDWNKLLAVIDFDATPISNGLLILGQIPNPENIGWGSVPVFNYLTCRKGVDCDYAMFTDHRIWVGTKRSPLVVGRNEILKSIFDLGLEWDCGDFYGQTSIPRSVTTDSIIVSRKTLRSYQFTTLKEAYSRARKARFEYGEKPPTEPVVKDGLW